MPGHGEVDADGTGAPERTGAADFTGAAEGSDRGTSRHDSTGGVDPVPRKYEHAKRANPNAASVTRPPSVTTDPNTTATTRAIAPRRVNGDGAALGRRGGMPQCDTPWLVVAALLAVCR